MNRVASRLARSQRFWDWLPVALLPPVLVLDAALNGDGPGVTPAGVLVAIAACLPLVLRRRCGFAVMAPLVTAGVSAVLWQLEPGDTVVLIPAVALAEIASRTGRRRVLWYAAAVVPCVLVGAGPFADGAGELFSILLRNVAYCWLALAAGDAVRSRREAVERAAAASEQEALRRVGEERLRMAQDVHDVVAHAIVEINVQAGVAAHLIDRDPDQARTALRNIKAASGDALTDLRATLGILRGGDAPIAPTEREDFDGLAAGLRAAGVDVTMRCDPQPPGVLRTATYRIVQEALTNVLRHARATSVRVLVRADADAVDIEVRDDGTGGGGSGGAGQGLRGVRERAAALGGSAESGPDPGGGWVVRAKLPSQIGTPA